MKTIATTKKARKRNEPPHRNQTMKAIANNKKHDFSNALDSLKTMVVVFLWFLVSCKVSHSCSWFSFGFAIV